MKEEKKYEHESYGMITVSKFNSNGAQFYGSDLTHNGGVSISISEGDKVRKLNSEWFHSGKELVRIELTHNQFVDAITSGMNTEGVPCTIKRFNGKMIPQISHAEDKKKEFSNDMKDTQQEYKNKIDNILDLMEEGNMGKKKAAEIKHQLEVLKSHISSNTNFVMKCFDESMDKAVTEAKHSIANYIDNKVTSLGIEAMREELNISLNETNPTKEDEK